MHSIHAFFQNGDFAGADTYLDGVIDQTAEVTGKVIRVPPGRTQLLAELFGTIAATRTYALIETPSIRTESRQYVSPLNSANSAFSDANVHYHPDSPRLLQEAEQMRALVNTDDAAAQDHIMVVWLGDGPVQPVKGKILTIQATAAVVAAAGAWRNGVITFREQLPVTRYQIVGMRVEATAGHAARLIIPDSTYRPGVPMSATAAITSAEKFRFGKFGVFGEFHVNQPPQLEVFGGNSVAQVIYLDLIRKE